MRECRTSLYKEPNCCARADSCAALCGLRGTCSGFRLPSPSPLIFLRAGRDAAKCSWCARVNQTFRRSLDICLGRTCSGEMPSRILECLPGKEHDPSFENMRAPPRTKTIVSWGQLLSYQGARGGTWMPVEWQGDIFPSPIMTQPPFPLPNGKPEGRPRNAAWEQRKTGIISKSRFVSGYRQTCCGQTPSTFSIHTLTLMLKLHG